MTPSMTLAETEFGSRILPTNAAHANAGHANAAHADAAIVKTTRTRNRLFALLIAAATALALVLASAVPARADRKKDDVLKALASIAAIALISKAVKDKKRRNTPAPAPVQMPRVPGVCAIEIGSGRGSVTGYAERCLREEGFNYRLPTGCATSIRIYGRADRFFPEQCLRDAGFRTPNR